MSKIIAVPYQYPINCRALGRRLASSTNKVSKGMLSGRMTYLGEPAGADGLLLVLESDPENIQKRYRGFHSFFWVLQQWMVYFMDNPIKVNNFWGCPYCRTPPLMDNPAFLDPCRETNGFPVMFAAECCTFW